VVASEVRSRARHSGAAVKEIKVLIGESSTKVEEGTSLVSDARKTIQEGMQAVERMTGLTSEIEVSALKQSDGIEQVKGGLADR
jgi:methyl-accepting chemotaxis protein